MKLIIYFKLKEFFNHTNIKNFFRLSYTQPSNGPKVMWIEIANYSEQDNMQDFNQTTVSCDQDKDNSSKGKGGSKAVAAVRLRPRERDIRQRAR